MGVRTLGSRIARDDGASPAGSIYPSIHPSLSLNINPLTPHSVAFSITVAQSKPITITIHPSFLTPVNLFRYRHTTDDSPYESSALNAGFEKGIGLSIV